MKKRNSKVKQKTIVKPNRVGRQQDRTSKKPRRKKKAARKSGPRLRETINALFPDQDEVIEIRALDVQHNNRRCTAAGYFTNRVKLCTAIRKLERENAAGIYTNLNRLNEAVIGRAKNRIEYWAKRSTSDTDVIQRKFMMIDIDPVRPSGTSASNDEVEIARAKTEEVKDALSKTLDRPAIVAFSGNGFHLLYRINIPNDDDATKLIKAALKRISDQHSNNRVKIDTAVHNAARIIRFYGTTARKGDPVVSQSRLHRRSQCIEVNDTTVSRATLENFIGVAPAKTNNCNKWTSHSWKTPEALQAYLMSHGVVIKSSKSIDNGREALVLKVCPFNPEHGGHNETAVIWSVENIGFKCHHDSCSEYKWRDAQKLIDPNWQDLQWATTAKVEDPHELARAVLDRYYRRKGVLSLRFYNGSWWHWSEGHYTHLPTREFKANLNRQTRLLLDEKGSHTKGVTKTLIENIAQATEGECLISASTTLPAWLGESRPTSGDMLNMSNGLLKLDAAISYDENCLLEPTPLWFSTTSWDFEYDPNAGCDKWWDFMTTVVPKNSHQILLQEFLGHCLTFDTSLQKFLILVGDGANGKSVVTEVATAVIGSCNVSAVGLERFGDRFALAPTIGKLANIVSEIPRIGEVAEDALKAIVSGERIRVEHKFQTPTDAKPTVRLLFATNELPRFQDRSSGIWRRMMVIPFDVTIPQSQQDPNLASQIIENERPGVFNWMLSGLKRLRHYGYFRVPKNCQEIVTGEKQAANPAMVFLDETVKAAGEIRVITLYQRYQDWCVSRSTTWLSPADFGKEVHRKFPDVRRQQKRLLGVRQYYYVGISLNESH